MACVGHITQGVGRVIKGLNDAKKNKNQNCSEMVKRIWIYDRKNNNPINKACTK